MRTGHRPCSSGDRFGVPRWFRKKGGCLLINDHDHDHDGGKNGDININGQF